FTPWAVDNKKFISNSSLIPPDKIKQKFSLFGTVFVTIGSLTQRKGIKNLLEAWSEANKHISNQASLLIIGDGPERQNLQNYVRNECLGNVVFTGHLNPEDIAPCLGASDVFVFPTLEDVWGLVANEAMSIGMPIICSKNAGCSNDLVIDNVNGNTFDPYNTQELAKILVEYVEKSETGTLKEFSLKSKEIISDFTIERSVNTISKIIEQA
ncbi:glycosyltransferase, partial [Candidatus Pacearchaeota archaeon]|nr:glycosyltransferase [Candidatus Pacearchaeota archaeon]